MNYQTIKVKMVSVKINELTLASKEKWRLPLETIFRRNTAAAFHVDCGVGLECAPPHLTIDF